MGELGTGGGLCGGGWVSWVSWVSWGQVGAYVVAVASKMLAVATGLVHGAAHAH